MFCSFAGRYLKPSAAVCSLSSAMVASQSLSFSAEGKALISKAFTRMVEAWPANMLMRLPSTAKLLSVPLNWWPWVDIKEISSSPVATRLVAMSPTSSARALFAWRVGGWWVGCGLVVGWWW